MYKLLLCWRYLRTRYIALASIVSVTLGVATMIVVNAVMAGFSEEMQNRIHGILADVVFEARSLSGFANPDVVMAEIRRVAGDDIDQMSAIVQVPAMLNYQFGGQWVTRPVQLVGIDQDTQNNTSDFGRYLQHPENRQRVDWNLREGGYDRFNHEAGPGSAVRPEMDLAGWQHRRRMWRYQNFLQSNDVPHDGVNPNPTLPPPTNMPEAPPATAEASAASGGIANPADPFAQQAPAGKMFDPDTDQHTGLVLGIALSSFRFKDPSGKVVDRFLALPGDDVKITVPTAAMPPQIVSDSFTVIDFYESKMSEYDSQLVFVPIDKLQAMRGMVVNPGTANEVRYVNAIQIKVKPGHSIEKVRDKLRAVFPPETYSVETWRDKQGPLLAAVQMETAILNVLLFLIIAVAGFGILAIFYMIVVEKTRDVGILKAMGASGQGVMGVFLSYGLLLGLVGSGAGMALGLLFTTNINLIAQWVGKITGQPVFDPSIYYFYEIPAIIHPLTVAWVVGGALLIAVLSCVLPARRAARLHPVEALRYE